MNAKDFWFIYNARCRRLETAGFSLKDYPLSGDHGCFEVSVFQNEKGIWCMESTIERSNDVKHGEFDSEEECFRHLLIGHDWSLRQVGFPVDAYKK